MNIFQGIIDVYDGNDLDFQKAWAAGVRAIFHQTTRGLYKVDQRYGDRKREALQRGFLWGGFHLLSPESPEEQLRCLLAVEDGSDPKIAVALDWERGLKGIMALDQLHAFINAFHNRLGRYPVLYGGSLLRETREIREGDALLAKCPLWYARYTDGALEIPTKTWPNYTFWQFDDEKRKHGGPPADVLPGADWNKFQGSADELAARWPFSGDGQAVPAPAVVATMALAERAVPAAPSIVERIFSTATGEWEFFGRQTYDVNGHVTHSGRKEAEDSWYQRVGRYWLEGTNTHGLDGRNDVPWSAAFISWVMKTAGAGSRFRYSTQHSVYIYQAIRDLGVQRQAAGFWAYRLNERKPQRGDLVCWGRENGIDYDNQNGGDYKGHCDIIVEVTEREASVIGGNVGDSVTRRPLQLDAHGYLPALDQGGENLFAIMGNRLAVNVDLVA